MTTSRLSAIFGGGALSRAPSALNNGFSGGGAATTVADITGAMQTLSGALTANTYKQMLSIAGSGVINLCSVSAQDTTSRTVGLQVIIDGVTVFDAVSAANVTAHAGIFAVGAPSTVANANTNPPALDEIPFNSSLVVSIKSSVTETNKLQLNMIYRS